MTLPLSVELMVGVFLGYVAHCPVVYIFPIWVWFVLCLAIGGMFPDERSTQ